MWKKHNKECLRTSNHMICKLQNPLRYATYRIEKGIISDEAYIRTGNTYNSPEEAKNAIINGSRRVK